MEFAALPHKISWTGGITMPVTISFTTVVSVSLGFFALSAAAEMGKGIAEDPVTREYSKGIYKDWQEGIVLDAATGNYLITYKNDGGSFSQIVFEPATKIYPKLSSKFQFSEKDLTILYRYGLRNGRESKQEIGDFHTIISNVVPGKNPISPVDWKGFVVPSERDSSL